MDSKKSKIAWFGVSTILIFALIYFADIKDFINALSSAEPLLFGVSLLFGLGIFPVFANAWHRFLGKVGLKQDFKESLRLFMAGQFMNSITPLGQFGGEPFMAYIIKGNTDLSYEKAFSTVLSADIINGIPPITFITGGTIYLLLFRSLNDTVMQTLYVALIVVGIGIPLVYLLWFRSGTVEGWIIKILRKTSDLLGRGQSLVEKIKQRLDSIQEAFDTIGESPRELAEVAIIAHLFFILQIFALYFVMLSLDIHPEFTPLYFIIVITGLSAYAPTPGGTGAAEAVMASTTAAFIGVPFVKGLTVAVLFRLATYWPGIVIGWIALNSLNGGTVEKAEELTK